MKTSTWKHAVVTFFIPSGFFILLQVANAQLPPNTITFDNQSGEFAIVKLMGPTKVAVSVPNGQERTVHAAAGNYYLLVRYGEQPGSYKYTKGDPFDVVESGRQYSIIKITLHTVIQGNYNTDPISGDEFENADLGAAIIRNVPKLEVGAIDQPGTNVSGFPQISKTYRKKTLREKFIHQMDEEQKRNGHFEVIKQAQEKSDQKEEWQKINLQLVQSKDFNKQMKALEEMRNLNEQMKALEEMRELNEQMKALKEMRELNEQMKAFEEMRELNKQMKAFEEMRELNEQMKAFEEMRELNEQMKALEEMRELNKQMKDLEQMRELK